MAGDGDPEENGWRVVNLSAADFEDNVLSSRRQLERLAAHARLARGTSSSTQQFAFRGITANFSAPSQSISKPVDLDPISIEAQQPFPGEFEIFAARAAP
jgi:hypothetical protein